MAMQYGTVTEGAFRAIRPAGFGGMFKGSVGTTEQSFDFKPTLQDVSKSTWQGELVLLQIIGGPAYYIFTETAADTCDITTERTDTDAAADPDIAGYLPAGNWPLVVPVSKGRKSVYLRIRSVSGTIDVRIHRT